MEKEKLYNPGEEVVESERLIMRRLRPDDYVAMAAWDMDERVYKYLMGSACKTPEEPLVWLPKKDRFLLRPYACPMYLSPLYTLEDLEELGETILKTGLPH